MGSLIVGVGVLVIVYGLLGLVAWRQPLIGRLAWREATRRPGQSALVVFGMMFGTASILAMQGLGDSFIGEMTSSVYHQWGRVDITVSANGRPFSGGVARALAGDPQLSGKATGIQGGLDLGGSAANLDRRLSTSPVQVVGFDTSQSGFGIFSLADGTTTDGRSLAADQAILSPSLGGRLEAKRGDHIRIQFALEGQQKQLELVVAGVARQSGSGGYGLAPGIFVPMTAFEALGLGDSINLVRISAQGDGQAEVDNARLLAPEVQSALSRISGATGLKIDQRKADDLAFFNSSVVGERAVLGSLSLVVVLAATALVVNLVLALAEERRPRLAVLRAVGLTRTGLVMVSVLEGALYSLAAGLLGILPGVAYAYLVDNRPAPESILNSIGAQHFAITPGTIAVSVCVGVLVTLVTIVAASIRTSRMAISSAIRDLPEPPRARKRSWLGIAAPWTVAALGAAAWLPGNLSLRMIGGAAIVIAASMLLNRQVSQRLRASLAGLVIILWCIAAILTARVGESVLNDALPTIVGLVLIVFGASTLLSANLRILEKGFALLSSDLSASLRPPLAYLTRRPLRAGLATGTVALVLGMVAFFAVLVPSFELQSTAVTSGYDVRATALGAQQFVIPSDLQRDVARTTTLITRSYIGQQQEDVGHGLSGWFGTFAQFYVLTDSQLADPPVKLATRDPRYASDAAAWQAIKNDPHLIVRAAGGGGNASNVLGQEWFKTAVGDAHFTTIGIFAGGVLSGYMGSSTAFDAIPAVGIGTTELIALNPGVDTHAFTRQLRQETFGQTVEAATTQDLVAAENAAGAWWFGFITLLMQTAVVVGVLSLGILALRSAIERRRTIGVLRALGYRPGQVLTGLLLEALLTAGVGILVGVSAGLLVPVASELVAGVTQPRVDAGQLVLTALVILMAVACVTAWPAIRASRLSTTEALRLVS